MKMTDYEDYENNLAFPPEGDWADTEPKNNTDRTASTIELVNKIEELNKWLDLKSEYIEKLETENKELKEQLDVKEAMIKNYTAEIETQRQQLEIAKDFIKFIVRYDCKVVVPKDFSKYEACWFFIRSLAQEKLEQIEELEK